MEKYGTREDYFYDGSHYISKSAFYKGASFMIYPTMEEVNRKLLIPGDRWHPFCPSSLPPWEIKLVYSQGLIPLKSINYPLNALEKYHVLLGREILLLSLMDRFYEPDNSLSLPVLDMADFFDSHDFQIGDGLRIHVLDYTHGIYKPEYVSRIELEKEKENDMKWLSLMDISMARVIHMFQDRLILPNQIDWAFFMGGQGLLKSPVTNTHSFLRKTDLFDIEEQDGIYYLVEKRHFS